MELRLDLESIESSWVMFTLQSNFTTTTATAVENSKFTIVMAKIDYFVVNYSMVLEAADIN